MRLIEGSVTLVLAGAWNGAILTPAWVAKYGLEKEGTVSVTLTQPVGQHLGYGAATPTYSLEGLQYSINPNGLVLSPLTTDPGGLELVQRVAQRVLAALPHTPLAAIGCNVGFEADDLERTIDAFRSLQRGVVDAAPEGWASSGNLVRTTLSKDGSTLNIDQAFDGAKAGIQFNFHTPITSGESAMRTIEALSFVALFDEAVSMASTILGEELREDEDLQD